MTFIINPGSGPVANSTFEIARSNIEQFCDDLSDDGKKVSGLSWSTDIGDRGRFSFTINVNDIEHEIDMPGIPLDQVRYLGEEGQNIWDFPRLYVDGSSWIWEFALNVCGEADEEEE